MTNIRKRALELYKPPFRFDKYGYVWDSENHMVADNHIDIEADGATARVRGWGRISYMEDAEALQDEVGKIMAEALNEYWNKQS